MTAPSPNSWDEDALADDADSWDEDALADDADSWDEDALADDAEGCASPEIADTGSALVGCCGWAALVFAAAVLWIIWASVTG